MLRVGRASADELAVELTLAPTAVARAAAQLSEAGLVALLADGESAPVDPRAGLRALTDRHTQQLDHIREEVPLLAQLFETPSGSARRAETAPLRGRAGRFPRHTGARFRWRHRSGGVGPPSAQAQAGRRTDPTLRPTRAAGLCLLAGRVEVEG